MSKKENVLCILDNKFKNLIKVIDYFFKIKCAGEILWLAFELRKMQAAFAVKPASLAWGFSPTALKINLIPLST